MIAVSVPLRRRNSGVDDVEDVAQQFDACDADRDGRILFSEYAQLVDGLGLEMSLDQRRRRFDEIDSDRDGAIDRDEFIAWLRKSAR